MGRTINRFGGGAACVGALLLGAYGAAAHAQDAGEPLPAADAQPIETARPADTAFSLPALTPVKLVIRAHLGSKLSTSGENFAIALAEPVVIDGIEVIPAGTAGVGEVVHAKKSGGSGASGELVLAARFLQIGERRLRLRSMNFAIAGDDATASVNTAMIASAATVPLLGLVGFFVKGKGIDIAEGTLAMAKTAEAFDLDPQLPPAMSGQAPLSQAFSPPPVQGDNHES